VSATLGHVTGSRVPWKGVGRMIGRATRVVQIDAAVRAGARQCGHVRNLGLEDARSKLESSRLRQANALRKVSPRIEAVAAYMQRSTTHHQRPGARLAH
jgi:hypothetical protein